MSSRWCGACAVWACATCRRLCTLPAVFLWRGLLCNGTPSLKDSAASQPSRCTASTPLHTRFARHGRCDSALSQACSLFHLRFSEFRIMLVHPCQHACWRQQSSKTMQEGLCRSVEWQSLIASQSKRILENVSRQHAVEKSWQENEHEAGVLNVFIEHRRDGRARSIACQRCT